MSTRFDPSFLEQLDKLNKKNLQTALKSQPRIQDFGDLTTVSATFTLLDTNVGYSGVLLSDGHQKIIWHHFNVGYHMPETHGARLDLMVLAHVATLKLAKENVRIPADYPVLHVDLSDKREAMLKAMNLGRRENFRTHYEKSVHYAKSIGFEFDL